MADKIAAPVHALNVVGGVLNKMVQDQLLVRAYRAPMFQADTSQYPVAFYSQGLDTRHEIIGDRDVEIEAAIRIEFVGKAPQLLAAGTVKGTDMVNLVEEARNRVIEADVEFFTPGLVKVPVELAGVPITVAPVVNLETSLVYAELSVLWQSGVMRV